MSEAERIEPDVQRKLLSKMEFDKYLNYEPKDIYYTLIVESTKFKRDR